MIIAGHHSMIGGGKAKITTASDYFANKLLLDGIENIGYGQHNSSASIWYDLIGGRSVSVNGNTWGEKSLYIDGQYHRINISNLSSIASTGLTVEIIAKLRKAQSNQFGRILSWRNGDSYVTVGIYWGKNTTAQARGEVWYTDYKYVDSSSSNFLEPHVFQYRYSNVSGGRFSIDCGAVPFSENIGNLGNLKVASTINIGYNANSNWSKFDCFGLRISDYYLSDAELAANYAIDKARFDLT